ncbi:hypothetical protein FOZ60_008183 [Perkinsus olseni]|uniref:Uncharacterized protein n=1 Tax=Perkinsus olseni TaxID=32597 RepID=A0A7J6NJU1_PEROL|nr:hypothetical protein FOZ60_008183 [Perkinsus olseni]
MVGRRFLQESDNVVEPEDAPAVCYHNTEACEGGFSSGSCCAICLGSEASPQILVLGVEEENCCPVSALSCEVADATAGRLRSPSLDVVRMYLDVSISTPSVHAVDDILCGSEAEEPVSVLVPNVRVGHSLSRFCSIGLWPPGPDCLWIECHRPQPCLRELPLLKKVADTTRPRVTTSAAASTWVKPVTVTCPTLAESKDLKVVMESTEDDANRYCVSVCGVGSWCKCDAAEGQPRICQHGLLQQCGYRLCDCSQFCGDRNGRRRLSASEQSQRLRYEGSVQFQVEHPSQADRVLEVIRYNLSGLDNEINSRTQGGLVRPAVIGTRTRGPRPIQAIDDESRLPHHHHRHDLPRSVAAVAAVNHGSPSRPRREDILPNSARQGRRYRSIRRPGNRSS